jgi:hypothetical protein
VQEVMTKDYVTGNNHGAQAINDAMRELTPATPAGTAASIFFPTFNHSSSFVYLGGEGRPSGYHPNFQQGNEDQGHHFAFYFQLGYGLTPTTISNVLQNHLLAATLPVAGEFLQHIFTIGRQPAWNPPDNKLGTIAMVIGAGARNGTISPSQAAAQIKSKVCK